MCLKFAVCGFLARRTKSKTSLCYTPGVVVVVVVVGVVVVNDVNYFQKLIITSMFLEGCLSYLVCMCIWTRPFHTRKKFDPYDLDLELRACV